MAMGRYRLLRVVDGRCNFAEVTVRAADSGLASRACASAELQSAHRVPQVWVEAAVQGAAAALGRRPAELAGVEVTSVVGSDVDTLPATVWCAAFCAVLIAAGRSPGDDPKALISTSGGRLGVVLSSAETVYPPSEPER